MEISPEHFEFVLIQELLAEEGFESGKFATNQRKFRSRDRRHTPLRDHDQHNIALPIYICHDWRSLDSSSSKHKPNKAIRQKGSSVFSSKRASSDSGRPNFISIEEGARRKDEQQQQQPPIDEVAIRAVVSILSGYVGQYLKDETFRKSIKERCYSCLTRSRNNDSDDGIFANFELGIESIENLVETSPGTKKELRMKSMRNSIRLLSIVASLNSQSTRNAFTCGIPNSHLSACAQLYLSIVYKLEKNDRICARHLLQVFCDSPFLARSHLLPDLWEHFFLPHLLHLKIWYSKEVEFVSNSEYAQKGKKLRVLSKVYNDQMDIGTTQFALYYKEWLKVGSQPPPVPSIPLPSRPPALGSSRRKSLDSLTSYSTSSKSLLERRSMDIDSRNRDWMIDTLDLEAEEKPCTHEVKVKKQGYAEHRTVVHRRSSSQNCRNPKAELRQETHKPDYFRCLTCQSTEPTKCLVHSSNDTTRSIEFQNTYLPPSDLSMAISTISSSECLDDCEVAIRVITKTWLDSRGDPNIEKTLSEAPVIEGMLEVLFCSNDDEVLELTISVLAEFAMRNEANRHIIFNSDPQLDIFMRLLRSNSLFLKSVVLLYLLKPKAKQMISIEWIPLVLRVLEFGDQLQTLLGIVCSPRMAAYYLLDQLLTGFDEDKNLENARHVVSTGGLSILVRRIECGDIFEKTKAASIVFCCIQADGSCRHYVAKNLNKDSILELLVKQGNSQCHAFALLTELLCLNRTTHAIRILKGLQSGWGGLNTMHILFVHLQKARVEERPMIAVILLQLDLLGDPLKCSVYREEVVEVIIEALDCEVCNEKIQEQSARALSMLGGRFSYNGEAIAEKWLLKEAGFDDDSSVDSFQGKDIVVAGFMYSNEEDDAVQNWQRKAAMVLLGSGKERLLGALCDSIANGIPSLSRASLVTVSWISTHLHSLGDQSLQSAAFSILCPLLIQSLNHDKALEERVLASFTLLTLLKASDSLATMSATDKGLMGQLKNLSQVTWAARELISIITSNSRHCQISS